MQKSVIITTAEEIEELKTIQSKILEQLENKGTNEIKPKFMPPKETAEYFFTDVQTLSKYAEKGAYEKRYFGERSIRYKVSEIEDFIENSIK